jgi:hypothetical protein
MLVPCCLQWRRKWRGCQVPKADVAGSAGPPRLVHQEAQRHGLPGSSSTCTDLPPMLDGLADWRWPGASLCLTAALLWPAHPCTSGLLLIEARLSLAAAPHPAAAGRGMTRG